MSIRGLDVSATGLAAYSNSISIISNNVANIETAAFKRSEARFQDLLYEQFLVPGAPSNLGDPGLGISYGEGSALPTYRRSSNKAIHPRTRSRRRHHGPGFFRVRDTRATSSSPVWAPSSPGSRRLRADQHSGQ